MTEAQKAEEKTIKVKHSEGGNKREEEISIPINEYSDFANAISVLAKKYGHTHLGDVFIL